MSRILSILCVCLSFVSAARAQERTSTGVPPEFERAWVQGQQALAANRNDEAIAAFQRCLAILPASPEATYNIACAHARKGELDAAFEHLGKAAELGFGNLTPTGVSNIDFALADPDLAVVRKDPRWTPLVARMRALRAAHEAASTAAPAMYVPEKIAAQAQVPVLIVLHDAGSTPEQVIAGRWRSIADELGCALIAPSGSIAVAGHAARGWTWFTDTTAYEKDPRALEASVGSGLVAFRQQRAIDAQRVSIAGEGLGGVVALSVALANPAQYQGVLAVDASLSSKLVSARAPSASATGLRVRLLNDTARLAREIEASEDVAAVVAGWNRVLASAGLSGSAELVANAATEPAAMRRAIVEALRGFAGRAVETPTVDAPK